MMRQWYIAMTLLLVTGLSACSPGTESPVSEEGGLDKYPELIQACKDWKSGGGELATGAGLEGAVYTVSSLDDIDAFDPKPGTLRFVVNQAGPRTIIFTVAGTIHLTAPLEIKQGNLTIMGQSAPGQGICVADYPVLINGASNVVIRFMRFRMGNDYIKKFPDKSKAPEYDAVEIRNTDRVVLDHCSCSWSVDECVSCYGNENFTMQYCFVTESLRDAGHPKGAHGYGGIWGGKNVSFHHNLLAHHDSRNPRFDHDYVNTLAGPIDYLNNVVYNWGGNSTYGGEGSSNAGGGRKINFVNNYYKPGPATTHKTRLLNPWASCGNCSDEFGGTIDPPHVFLTGNYMYGSDVVTGDNWKGVSYSGGATEQLCRVNSRYPVLHSIRNEELATVAYETVLSKAGCSLERDAIDQRISTEVREGKCTYKGSKSGLPGLIDSQEDVGGWPELSAGEKVADTDRDGMPDEWEKKYGLDPNSSKDQRLVSLVTGYTNLEVYLCDIVKHLY